MWIKNRITNAVSLSGVIVLIISFFLPFHELGCKNTSESVYSTVAELTEMSDTFVEFMNQPLLLSTIPNLFALYLLCVFIFMRFYEFSKSELILAQVNLFLAAGIFAGLSWFFLGGYFVASWPLGPILVHTSILALVFLFYLINNFREKDLMERFYLFQMFGAVQSFIFYLSLMYFFVIDDRYLGYESRSTVWEAFCHGYWLSLTACVFIMLGASKTMRRILDESIRMRRTSRRWI